MAEKRKLTVRVDSRWIDEAEEYAARHNTSLSKLISEFLRNLPVKSDPRREAPILKRVSGILPPDVTAQEHRTHLEEKYGINDENSG
ncbi:MAG: DUF6364 family protein [Anaerolineales bacterium]|nr:DUF6364 family protein [Anaerolineales bacterium]